MTTIVYCYYLPEHDDSGTLLKLPPHVLRWTGWNKEDNEPVTFGVLPYIINTSDEQVALRTIAPRLHEVVALSIIKPALRPHISRLVMHAEELPRTLIVDSFDGTGLFNGLGNTHGMQLTARPGDMVLLSNQVERLQQYPFNKCVDQLSAAYVKDIIRRRQFERGLPFVKPASESPSVSVIHPATFNRAMQEHTEAPAREFPLTELTSIRAVKLAPQARPKPLPAEPEHPADRYHSIQPVPMAERPPREPADAEGRIRPFRADIDG